MLVVNISAAIVVADTAIANIDIVAVGSTIDASTSVRRGRIFRILS